MGEDAPAEDGRTDGGPEEGRAHPTAKAVLTAAPFVFLLALALLQWCP